MELWNIVLFASVLAVALVTPGPTVVLIVARVLAMGRAGHVGFCTGLVLGDVVWLAAAVFGLVALAQAAHGLLILLKFAGCAYLLWLAYSLWTAPIRDIELPSVVSSKRTALGDFLAGLAVTLSNPKAMVFYLVLLPNLVDMDAIDAFVFAELSAIVVCLFAAVLVAYMWAAARARRLFGTPRAMRRVQRGSAVLLAGTAAAVATR